MLILIIGGSGSGKSAFAEKRARELAGTNLQKYYLATMAVHDDEMRKKVQRHQMIRKNDEWITLEYPVDIGKGADLIPVKKSGTVILLEDLGNLTANEMFRDGRVFPGDEVCEKISRDISVLESKACAVIIVSNQIFNDGISYDKETMQYIEAMGKLHQKLAERAVEVTEVVVGIPARLK